MKKLFGILALIAAILTTTGTSAQSGSDDAVSWLEEITVTADFFGGTELSFNRPRSIGVSLSARY